MSAWLSFADALAVADAICEAAKEIGHNESEGRSRRILKTQ
jgi:hypothetical protein